MLAVLLFGSIGLQLVIPQIMRAFIDSARAGEALETLMTAAIIFIGVALVQQVVSVVVAYISENVALTATNALRSDLVRRCLDMDMSFHHAHPPGEMIERIDGDVNALSNFFSQFILQIVGNALLLTGILILLFREDWRVGLGLTLFAIMALFVLGSLRNIAVPYWTASRQASADLFGFLEERLAGTEDIRSNHAKPYVLRRFFELTRVWLTRDIKTARMVNIMVNASMVLVSSGAAIGLALGAYLYQEGTITIGTVYLIFHYTTMLAYPVSRLVQQMEDLQKASASLMRIHHLTITPQKIHDGPGITLPDGPLSVTFDRVSFAYVDDEPVLRSLSFSLEPGTVLGLLGRTGSGKTTITRLLFRLYDPTDGVVRLNGQDIRDARVADLRQRIGVVTQQVQLFRGTLRDNLTLFDRSLPDERLLEVIDGLGLLGWYDTQPDGLDTLLAPGGEGLSAGEAQLLALTRIFLRDPDLVILDEASSRLDPATEQLIEHALDRLLRNRTAIIIAHRLATVQRADHIMILEDGRICEHGRREQLMQDPSSRFSALLQTGLEEAPA